MKYSLTDLQSCCNQQLARIGSIIQEALGKDRYVMKLFIKVMLVFEYYLYTVHRISKNYYRGSTNKLMGTGQENQFQEICTEISQD